MKEMLIVLGLLFFLTTSYFIHLDAETLASVKESRVDLICNLVGKGETKIDPDMIKGYRDNTWYFVNGQATNCELESK